MVTWADSPEGPWSTPIDLKIGGIDPEHVVSEDGNVICCSVLALYIRCRMTDTLLQENRSEFIKEWEIPEEWDIEGVSMEGLNVKKVGEYYYLFAAEGGTAGPPTSHMVVQARSKNIMGPWENAPFNPLLRTESRYEKWWSERA